jgi:hypothetical protein
LGIVGDGGEPPAQFDGRRQLATAIEGSSDRSGFGFADDEHRGSIARAPRRGKAELALAPVRTASKNIAGRFRCGSKATMSRPNRSTPHATLGA